MSLARLGIIGSGAIATLLMDALARELPKPLEAILVLGTQNGAPRAEAAFAPFVGRVAARIATTSAIDDLVAAAPDLVVECAGHGAVAAHVPRLLEHGIDVVLVSIGALADDALRGRIEAAGARGGARVVLSPGALGGVDLVSAARLAGIAAVTYTSRKPPAAWRDTPAEALLDLATLDREAIFFDGNARDAARLYPKNANVAAMIALAGPGFEATRVRLVADPDAGGNVHEITLASACADASFRITGKPMPDNPRTSTTTAYALAREVLNRVRPIVT